MESISVAVPSICSPPPYCKKGEHHVTFQQGAGGRSGKGQEVSTHPSFIGVHRTSVKIGYGTIFDVEPSTILHAESEHQVTFQRGAGVYFGSKIANAHAGIV